MDLYQQAKEVLLRNWKDGFTIPTRRLYPFQWNWDSGFTSLGYGHFELGYAIRELRTLFSGQWDNGMIPHIIFHSEDETSYFPNHDFWQSSVNIGAPQHPKSSGITQPPVHGFILEQLYIQHPHSEELRAFIAEIYPKIVQSHRWFYSSRDPMSEGLTYIYHPWESGRDNSPIWDASISRIDLNTISLPPYQRKDTAHASSAERPTDDKYDRYVYLLELGKKYQYDGIDIYHKSPFLIQDTLMNAILIKSNDSLIRLGKIFNYDTTEIKNWQEKAIPAYRRKLWSESHNTFMVYDLRGECLVQHKEIGGFSAMYAQIPTPQQADKMHQILRSWHDRQYYLCPSFDIDDPLFDSKRYWRGPIWPQMNWLISKGLREYGYHDTADTVRDDLIHLVEKLGFYEYFEAQKSVTKELTTGYGGNHFSWTAACILDLLSEQKQK